MEIKSLGSVLLRARKKKRWKQEDVARQVPCDRRRIADYESGRLQPDARVRGRMAKILELSVKLLERLAIPPPEADAELAKVFRSFKPRFEPRGERETAWQLLALWRSHRGLFQTLWGTVGRRPDKSALRLFFRKVRTDSKLEALAWLKLAVWGMIAARLAPLHCGFRVRAIVNPDTLEVVGDCVVSSLVCVDGHPRVIFPQQSLSVNTKAGHARPDGLVGVRVAGGYVWCVVEFDGPGHDPDGDASREDQLGMPVVRFTKADIMEPEFPRRFWQRVYGALGIDE